MSYRIWAIRLVAVLVFLETVVALLNFRFDPLWCFGSVNSSNATAIVIDVRQQKSNLVAFGPADFDTLIIGSSRIEPLAASDFPGQKAFNYSLSALFPDEYQEYIDYFRSKNGKSLRRIYLGLDFFGTIEKKPIVNLPPRSYFDGTEASNNRLNNLLSADPLIKLAKGYFRKDYYYRYDRRANVLTPRAMTAAERQKFIEKRLSIFKDKFYADGAYRYNRKYKELLASIAAHNRDLDLKVFTSPVSKPLFEQLVRQGRYPDYERWLRDTVEIFGSVTNFMTINSVTDDLSNFYDADHLYPAAARHLSWRLCGQEHMNVPPGFGEVITRETLEDYLAGMRRRVAALSDGLNGLKRQSIEKAPVSRPF